MEWYQENPQRWQQEQDLARERLADVEVGFHESGVAFIRGTLPLMLDCGHELDRFRIRIDFPARYMRHGAHPEVHLESHHDRWQATSDGHMKGWRMCLYVPMESGLDLRRVGELHRLLEHVHTFLFRQRVYQQDLAREKKMNGPVAVWPGPARAHFDEGLVEAIIAAGGKLGRNEPCVCGSGRKYKHCHLSKLDENVKARLRASSGSTQN